MISVLIPGAPWVALGREFNAQGARGGPEGDFCLSRGVVGPLEVENGIVEKPLCFITKVV